MVESDIATVLNFSDKYTTAEKKAAYPEKEKDKTVISNDAYATGENLEKLKDTFKNGFEAIRILMLQRGL